MLPYRVAQRTKGIISQVPSAIDVVVWNDGGDIIASPISPSGKKFLKELTGEEDTDTVQVQASIEEFMSHIPPGLNVYFNRDDGKLVHLSVKFCLQ